MNSIRPQAKVIKVSVCDMNRALIEETGRFGYVWGGKKVETFYQLDTFLSREDKIKGVNRPSKSLTKDFLDPFENKWIQHIYIKYPTEEVSKGRWIFKEKVFEHQYNLDLLSNFDQMIEAQGGIAPECFNQIVSPETAVVRLGGTFEFIVTELDMEDLFDITPIYRIDGKEYTETEIMNKYLTEWEMPKIKTEEDSKEKIVTTEAESVKIKELEQKMEAQSKEVDDLKLLLQQAIGALQNGNSDSPRPSDIYSKSDVGDDR
jgi:hypothetical protein